MRDIENRFDAMEIGVDDDNSLGVLLASLPEEDRAQYAHEGDIAWPYMLQGIDGEELYKIVDEELKKEAAASVNL